MKNDPKALERFLARSKRTLQILALLTAEVESAAEEAEEELSAVSWSDVEGLEHRMKLLEQVAVRSFYTEEGSEAEALANLDRALGEIEGTP